MTDDPLNIWWANQTVLHPAAMGMTAIAAAFSLALPRRWALAPLFALICFVSPAQRFVIAEIDFTLSRMLLIVLWTRTLMRGEMLLERLNTIDKLVIWWILVKAMAFVALHSNTSAMVNRAGYMVDSLGVYLLVRAHITGWSDIRRLIIIIGLIAVPVTGAFILERLTARNIFGVFGGVPTVTMFREGRLRCQGAFAHPILAGCFWASLLPLMAVTIKLRGSPRFLARFGAVACLIIVFTCASSTPVMGVLAATVGAALYLMRKDVPTLRGWIIALLFVLHFVMKNPVWHLVSRIDLVGGSTGWHRYHLIDQAIKRFSEWAVMGTKSTVHWGLGLFDVTCQYVSEAVEGGFLTVVLFIFVLIKSFSAVGRYTAYERCGEEHRRFAWAIGVSMMVHAVSFIAVTYFGQIQVIFFSTLALTATLADLADRRPALEEAA